MMAAAEAAEPAKLDKAVTMDSACLPRIRALLAVKSSPALLLLAVSLMDVGGYVPVPA